LQLGDLVFYQGEKYKVVWIYDENNLEIKSIRKVSSINQSIPVHVSELQDPAI
jgi:hypothetical protein